MPTRVPAQLLLLPRKVFPGEQRGARLQLRRRVRGSEVREEEGSRGAEGHRRH